MSHRIAIVLALCAAAAGARAETVKLANGDSLTGTVVEWAVDHLILEHPQLGRVRLSLDQLDIDRGEPPSPGLFGTSFLRGWTRSVNFGWNGKMGNSENLNLTGGVDFHYSDAFKRWRFNGRYFLNTDETGVTDNNARVDLRRDWLFPGSAWFAFASGRYQYDEFESWKHRTVLAAGPGYHLIQREDHGLDARLGATFTREYGGSQDNRAEALFALDYEWKPAERFHLRLSNEFYTEVAPNSGELRNLTIGEIRILLKEKPNLNFVVGAENEYETDLQPGDKPNDFKYYLTLALGF